MAVINAVYDLDLSTLRETHAAGPTERTQPSEDSIRIRGDSSNADYGRLPRRSRMRSRATAVGCVQAAKREARR